MSGFILTSDMIELYIKEKRESGVSEVSLNKIKVPLYKLLARISADTYINAERLAGWRKGIEADGYSKYTIQGYVKVVNNFLRHFGYKELCIPKAMQADITNKSFGYLTAVEPIEKRHRNNVVWKCRCRCGNEVYVPATLLINMNTTSCGCLNTEILHYVSRFVEGTSLTRSMKDNPKSRRAESGYTGVTKKNGKWQAYIYYKKKRYNLGTYETVEQAAEARAKGKARVIEDAERLYEETAHLYGEAMPKRPPKPDKNKSQEEMKV